MNRRYVQALLGTAALAAAVAAFAQEPVQNVDPKRHGNIAAAQNMVRQAYDRITVAQQDNRYDLGGHANRAKDLLRQANQQLKLAAEAANRR
jgi:predicted lipoprotein with Yx(FWY)xxD motif